ncbi:MAG: hypothetical protein ACOX6V_03595 [Patescibacteria group bacterium]|jgi:hypothetical protein
MAGSHEKLNERAFLKKMWKVHGSRPSPQSTYTLSHKTPTFRIGQDRSIAQTSPEYSPYQLQTYLDFAQDETFEQGIDVFGIPPGTVSEKDEGERVQIEISERRNIKPLRKADERRRKRKVRRSHKSRRY